MKRVFLIVIVLIGFTEAKTQVLTLQEAINIALKNSLDIEIARSNIEASQINNHISMAGGLPEVSGTLSNNRSLTNLNQKLNSGSDIQRNGTASNAVSGGITGSFVLFNGFRVYATKSRLAALEKQSEQQVALQIQNIIRDVMVTYYDIVRQDSYIKTIQQSLEVTQQRKLLVEARQSVGLANNADTYQAQLDLVASQQELQSQQLILTQSKADLMNLLTQRPDSNFVIRDTILVDSTINLTAVTQNINNNPEILAADQQIRVNEFIEREVGSQRYPAVTLDGGFNFSRNQSGAGNVLFNQNYGPFIGLGLQVPIFNGGITRRQMRIAEIDTRNATSSRQIAINNLLNSVTKAWQAYQNNLQRLETEKENNRIAAALLNLTLQRFQLSAATIVEVREAQRSFVEAGYRLVNLSYAAKVGEIELKRIGNQLVP